MVRRRPLLLAGWLAVAGCAGPSGLTPRALSPAPLMQGLGAARGVPAHYYDEADGLSGKALLQALKRRISDQQALTYNDARDAMFADVDDATHTDTIVSVYTAQRGRGIRDRRTADRQGFATEHTWPQSLGAGWADAKTDLHHLFPVVTRANSIRGNNPFGIVVKARQTLPDQSGGGQPSKLGTNAAGVQVFEPPDRHKGDVARALMYFYVRYALPKPGDKAPGPLSLRNFEEEVAVLLSWHHRDPVDAAEIRRNDLVADLQGNRNPFVDRPEFADRAGASFSEYVGAEGQ